jgi:hypothetical protein
LLKARNCPGLALQIFTFFHLCVWRLPELPLGENVESIAMTHGAERVKLETCELALDLVSDVIAEGDAITRLWGLRVMALVVANFPAGSLQDSAEDILSTFIAEADLDQVELASVRDVRCTGELRAICS